ncbi:hypothetical protein [Aliihoeflea sp. 40Bstr573]|uniref:hypothetical protein n=1 Tax=Aliihoeflea sp. 40Bstr573 TaxID=2696467 RepID=UPI00209471E2|nr:hypothetical protein [Aliihoeflea sp. 40Bstr573]MCO6386689.1 hypothetical protein [Aliihoeflea sp. 40Bstr573]
MPDSSNGSTWVYSAKLESAFRKVSDIQEFVRQYVIAPDKLPVSVEDTQWAIEEKYGFKITKELVDFEAEHIRGMMERYENGTAHVFIRQRQDNDLTVNGYWHRFIAVKELSHLAIDEKEDFNWDGSKTIEELIADHIFEGMRPAKIEIQSEVLAELVAIEILYPMEFRQADIESGRLPSDLAKDYGVPPYVIERALSQGHMKMARALWHEIGGHGLGGLGSDPAG